MVQAGSRLSARATALGCCKALHCDGAWLPCVGSTKKPGSVHSGHASAPGLHLKAGQPNAVKYQHPLRGSHGAPLLVFLASANGWCVGHPVHTMCFTSNLNLHPGVCEVAGMHA